MKKRSSTSLKRRWRRNKKRRQAVRTKKVRKAVMKTEAWRGIDYHGMLKNKGQFCCTKNQKNY